MTRLCRVRMSLGLSRAHVCEKTGVSQGHYCYLEQGRHRPTRATAERIAAVLGTTADDLFPKGFSRRYTQRPFGRGPRTVGEMQEPIATAPPWPYPQTFVAQCGHCHASLGFRTDDQHPLADSEGRCYQCGAIFYRGIMPLSEAANV